MDKRCRSQLLLSWSLVVLIPAGARIAFAAPTLPYERYDPDANVWRVQGSVAPISSDPDAAAETRASWRFGPNVNVSTSGQQIWPDIIRFGVGNLCASWMDDRTGTYKIYSSVSTDGGKTWLADQMVDDSPPWAYARFVTLAPYGASDLVAVWEDKRSFPTWNVYLSRGTWNAGTNQIDWSSSKQINTTGGATNPADSDYMHPSVVTDGGNVYVAWADWREGFYYQIYSRASTDGGLTWKPEVRISDEIGNHGFSGDPSLVVDYGSSAVPRPVACAWTEYGGYDPGFWDVSFARSTDGGQTWTNPTVRVNDITDAAQSTGFSKRVVAITPLTHTINVGWINSDSSGLYPEMRVSRSTDNGATWLASNPVSDPYTDCGQGVSLTAGFGEDVLTAWVGKGSDWNVLFRASDDAGVSWSPILRADNDNTGASSEQPNVASLPDGSPLVVMRDSRDGGSHTWVARGRRSGSSSVGGEASVFDDGAPACSEHAVDTPSDSDCSARATAP